MNQSTSAETDLRSDAASTTVELLERLVDVPRYLNRILASDAFRRSQRLSDFPSYVVDETLAGRSDQIAAPQIAMDVFKRGGVDDSEGDGLVRVQARQLRLKLSSYYDTEGQNDRVRIRIPTGGYAPVFEHVNPIGETRQDRPASAVEIQMLPIECATRDDILQNVANAMGHDIMSALTRFADLQVFVPKEDPSRIGQDQTDAMRPTFRFGGHLAADGKLARFTMALIANVSGRVVWSQQYTIDTDKDDVLAAQQRIAAKVAIAIGSPSGVVIQDVLRHWEANPELAEHEIITVFRAHRYNNRPNAREHAFLREALELASRRAGASSRVWALLSRMYLDEIRFRYNPRGLQTDALRSALDAARNAVHLAQDCSFSWFALALVYFERRETAKYVMAYQKALELNPNDTDAMAALGNQTWLLADMEDGLALTKAAIALNERSPGWYFLCLVHDAIRRGDFDAALELCVQVEMQDFFWPNFLEAVIYGHLGDAKRFDRALAGLNADAPWFLTYFEANGDTLPFPSAFKANLKSGIRKGLDLGGHTMS